MPPFLHVEGGAVYLLARAASSRRARGSVKANNRQPSRFESLERWKRHVSTCVRVTVIAEHSKVMKICLNRRFFLAHSVVSIAVMKIFTKWLTKFKSKSPRRTHREHLLGKTSFVFVQPAKSEF